MMCFWWAHVSCQWRAWHLLSSSHCSIVPSHSFSDEYTHTQVQTKHTQTKSLHTPLHVSHVKSCLWMRDCGRKAEVLTGSCADLSVTLTPAQVRPQTTHTLSDWILCILLFVRQCTFIDTAHITSFTNSGNRLALCQDIICTGVCLMFGWVIIGHPVEK